ncbi:MAG: YggT family protein [Beijerinckiaceae bacterium]
MRALIEVFLIVLDIYVYVVFAAVIMSWLLAFNIVNFGNNIVRAIWNGLNALTEPVLGPIRRIMPNLGAIDISPIVLLLGIILIQKLIQYNVLPYVR